MHGFWPSFQGHKSYTKVNIELVQELVIEDPPMKFESNL